MKNYIIIVLLFCFAVKNNAQNKINQYEYWFDNDYTNKVVTSITPVVNYQLNTQISTSGLNPGLHSIHFRFRDDSLNYSSVISQFFYKTFTLNSIPTLVITHYEYWFDNDYANKVLTPFSGNNAQENLITNISTASLSQGIHSFHIRFKDNNDNWSSVLSQFFYKQINQTSSPSSFLTHYEYWFDNDYANKVLTPFSGNNAQENLITNISTTSLSQGIHSFHIRFKDNNDNWSSVLSSFFYKMPAQNPISNNLITAYRYWFDNSSSNFNTHYFSVPTPNINLIENLDLTNVWKGPHYIHFQFKDTLGMWSVVLSDSIYKVPFPIAEFNANDTTICVGDTVYFTSLSIDGDTHLWDFGDGNFSTDSLTQHAYLNAGTYTVSLTVVDIATGKDSTISKNIYVTAYPSTAVVITGNDTLCQGQSAQLSLQASNATYLWNTLEQTSTITVNASGQYFATITSTQNTSCSVQSDTINVLVNPLPVVNLGNDTTICEGNNLVLDATNTNSTYSWNTGAQTPTITVNQSNQYQVTVTNQYGCVKSDTIDVTVNPLPIADFTYVVNNQTVTFTNTSQFGTGYNWDFGDGETSVSQNPTHTFPLTGGTFTITLTVTNNCGNNVYTQVITIEPNNVIATSQKNFDINIYPNPTRDKVNITVELDKEGLLQIAIYDYTGKFIGSILNETRPEGTQYIWYNTQALSAGIYYIEILNNDNRQVKKLVVNK